MAKGGTFGLLAASVAVVAALLVAAVPAPAQTWEATGRGFGHGAGMSQWGAHGMASSGKTHEEILAHYYRRTSLGTTRSRSVRVLLREGTGPVRFTGVDTACGRKVEPSRTHVAERRSSAVFLRTEGRLHRCGTVLRASGKRLRIAGLGRYRGSLEVRLAGNRLRTVNRVGIEGYVMGVLPGEVPASWPAAALEAQAVAARTYAVGSGRRGAGFDHYADTRSQVYKGLSAEHPRTNAAARATRHQVLTHEQRPIEAFFFSSSGGRTASVEHAFIGAQPRPYLVSVDDPGDRGAPHHRWGPVRFTSDRLGSALGAPGSLRQVEVLERGSGGRVLRARVVGSRGSRTLTGPEIRTRLGLRSHWVTLRASR